MSLLKRLTLTGLCALSIVGAGFVAPKPVYAQVGTGLNAVGSTIVLQANDPRVIAARIINIFLGLVGIILVSLILYAGFLWMTSGGEAEKIDRAKAYIRNAIIGLVIVLSSWAIATFVINQLLQATGGGPGGTTGGGGPGGGLGGSGVSSAFQVRAITPTGSVPIRNVQVKFIFSRPVNEASALSHIDVLRASDGVAVGGTVSVSNAIVTFTPDANCPAPNADRKCFDATTEFIARANSGLESSTGQTLACGGFAPACEGHFTTGDLIDVANPNATILAPFNGQSVSVDDAVVITSRATDDAGVSYIDTLADGTSVGTVTASATSLLLQGDVFWDTTGATLGRHTLQAQAFDIDSNTDTSADVSVYVRPAHCFNGTQDDDETGLDCGGSTCGSCSGGSCTTGGECASGVCTAGVCVDQPVMTGVTPADGRQGTLVTISGANFGTTPGTVRFYDGQVASAPAVCTSAGISTWSSRQVVVAVPDAAITGPIELTNASTSLLDTTNNDIGPVLDDYIVNDVARPGLCGALPSAGLPGERFELVGVGLGDSSDMVFFNDREIRSFLSWSDTNISLNTPVYTPARYGVTAKSGGVESNSIAYSILARGTGEVPVIDTLSASAGPVGEYITLTGRHFGSRIGRVVFTNNAREEGNADVNFPDACAMNFWTDTGIVIKVPRHIGSLNTTAVTPGTYAIRVIRQDTVESDPVDFTVNTDTPHPGICAIRPQAGPVDTEVQLIGERFGSSGRVTFKGTGDTRVEASVGARDYTSNQIVTHVPRGAETGSVTLAVDSVLSNPVEFSVRNCNEDATICSAAGETCCRSGACSVGGTCPAVSLSARYAWRTSTGIIPINPQVIEECNATALASPSPWDARTGGSQACVNSDVVLRFTTKLNYSTVIGSGSGATILVNRCTAGGETPCATTELVIPRAGYPMFGLATDGSDYILFRPNLPDNVWAPNSTYEIILRTGILSDTGIPMLERPECGSGNSYCFTFTTRSADDVCRVGSVNVSPDPFTANEIGEISDGYRAFARAEGDICIILDSSGMNWSWDTLGDGRASDGRASITSHPPPGADQQTGTAIAETGDIPVPINATVLQDTEAVQGTGDLYIRFIPPKVVGYGPNCDEACVNAAIWAKFNVAMDPASVSRENVLIYRCANENCSTFSPLSPLDLSGARISLGRSPGSSVEAPLSYLLVEPTRPGVGGAPITLLEPGRFYKVILRGGIDGFTSAMHLPLTDTNDPLGFSWSFHVRAGDNPRCGVDKVIVTPLRKYESAIGKRQSFSAIPLSSPDKCNADGEPLIIDASFNWSQSDTNVAKFINARGDGVIDTTYWLPDGCSSVCTNTGASGVAGHIANCGNDVIETSNPEYCRNRAGDAPCGIGEAGCLTVHGEACTLLPPGSKGSEECDDAGANGSAGRCSNACLWNPVTGGSCGNGTVDPGEQCDSAKFCSGGPTSGASCSADTDCGGGTGLCIGVAGCSDTCQLLGSRAGGSVCGNGSIGAGEACDDGNTQNGDGCNRSCLDEGSRPVIALCGDGIIEMGESCDGGPGCDPVTCLNIGTDSCGEPGELGCCGNTTPDPAEDCDDGNTSSGDGCSARCLVEGSSPSYIHPSFCGDGGAHGTGEQCEVTAPDGLIDPVQLSEIIGDTDPGADGRMQSTVSAEYETKTGEGIHGLQCGFTDEASCADAGTGLANNGCCSLRPVLTSFTPPYGATAVCRNAMISGTFNVPMNQTSLQTNLLVASEHSEITCPEGSTPLVDDLAKKNGILQWFANAWTRVKAFFGFAPANAQVWCAGEVSGRVIFAPEGTGTKASFQLDHALAANTKYKVVFRGDNDLTNTEKRGIQSMRGVVVVADAVDVDYGRFTWSFTTGPDICAVSAVNVKDTFVENPSLFTQTSETHTYVADVITLDPGYAMAISPVAEYNWSWQPWISSHRAVLTVAPSTDTPEASQTTVTSQALNGTSYIYAGLRITNDEVHTPSTTNQVIRSSLLSTVLLCEQPWPDRDFAPFSDKNGSLSLAHFAPSFLGGPWFNFSTLYCKDAGDAASTADDLPHAKLTAVPLSELDRSLGILRQYLFTFAEPSLAADGIGIRIIQNPLHLSAKNWYTSRGFTGSPESTTVDGYEALRDGATVYVSAANTDRSTLGSVYSNIYILSRNPDAKPETQNIFDQLVENFTLNVNIENNSMNVCVNVITDEPSVDLTGATVECTADWECLQKDPATLCASFKNKLQRDIQRIADFQVMTDQLQSTNDRAGTYPLLRDGSFVQTLTTSRWPSWQGSFQSEVGASMPTDPVNRFLTCGTCSRSRTACVDDSECSNGETCAPTIPGIDPQTCWNESTTLYQCPLIDSLIPENVSRIYQYRAVDGGRRYELATELEGPRPNRWVPPLRSEIKYCSNLDSICQRDSDCTVRSSGGMTISEGTCNSTGGNWVYEGICRGRSYGIDDVCGNGVVGPAEACEIGDTRPVACTIAGGVSGTKLQTCSDCTGFIDGPTTSCIANVLCGNGRIDRAVCRTTAGGPGMREGTSCSSVGSPTECADPADPAGTVIKCVALPASEACDDGALNGLYGHCGIDCRGYDAFCGDGELSPGESCDNGSRNGEYCSAVDGCNPTNSCSFDCRTVAPYCGDHVVNGTEQCDNSISTTTSALCKSGPNQFQPCETNDDCPGGSCGGAIGGADLFACDTTPIKRCTNVRACTSDTDCASSTRGTGNCVDGLCRNDSTYPCSTDARCDINVGGITVSRGTCLERETQRTRTCVNTLDELKVDPVTGATSIYGVADLCGYKTWSNCLPVGSCGDGIVNDGEECDDGNRSNNDACTNNCTVNVCGDSYLRTGVEQCDYGTRNGDATCRADYGSTCTNCNATCQQVASSGGFCGDGVLNGGEQCDGTEGLSDVSCTSLGFDYAEKISCATYGYISRISTGEIIKVCNEDHVGYGLLAPACETCSDGSSLATCDLKWTPTSLTRSSVDARLADQLCLPDDPPSCSDSGSICLTRHQPRQDVVTCSSACGYSGCARCSDSVGTESVSGQIFDAIYSNQPVPNARISVFQRGVRIPALETFTDADGRFTINGLVGLDVCANYRIVVDSFEDNPCTGPSGIHRGTCNEQDWSTTLSAPDESTYGGYWSFESGRFGVNNFGSMGLGDSNGHIFLAPRVGPGETLVVHTWNGALPYSYIDAHLTLPPALTPPSDVYYGNPGNSDINGASPHAFLACYHTGGGVGCGSFSIAPQTMKYERGDWAVTGRYGYYLVNYDSNWSGGELHGAWKYFGYVSSTVRIITSDRVYTVTPPTGEPTDTGCSDESTQLKGKYWLVFTQNPSTGDVTIPSGHGEYLCNGSKVYGSITPARYERVLPTSLLDVGT